VRARLDVDLARRVADVVGQATRAVVVLPRLPLFAEVVELVEYLILFFSIIINHVIDLAFF
jgi:hypothetical protein